MTAAPQTRSVVIEREVAFPPEKVWRALTQPHLIEEWLMPGGFAPVAGHRFQWHNRPRPDVHIVIDSEVLAIEPHRTLAYRWDALGLESIVTWTLTETATGTRLRMEHSGFRPDQEQAFRGATAGWHAFLPALERVLADMD